MKGTDGTVSCLFSVSSEKHTPRLGSFGHLVKHHFRLRSVFSGAESLEQGSPAPLLIGLKWLLNFLGGFKTLLYIRKCTEVGFLGTRLSESARLIFPSESHFRGQMRRVNISEEK